MADMATPFAFGNCENAHSIKEFCACAAGLRSALLSGEMCAGGRSGKAFGLLRSSCVFNELSKIQ